MTQNTVESLINTDMKSERQELCVSLPVSRDDSGWQETMRHLVLEKGDQRWPLRPSLCHLTQNV